MLAISEIKLTIHVSPLLSQIADRIGTWCWLPLSVIGRGNHIKMVLMQQILYIHYTIHQSGFRCT